MHTTLHEYTLMVLPNGRPYDLLKYVIIPTTAAQSQISFLRHRFIAT